MEEFDEIPEELNAGWWHGCYECEAHKDQIEEIQKEKGTRAAIAYALEHLAFEDARYLCDECLKEWRES